jgi:Flagellar biosynthesis protein, FliO
MELMQTRSAQVETGEAGALPVSSRFFRLAVAHLKSTYYFAIFRAKNKRKRLTVRETAALGDRRFVSVIQFEHQRFLIGSSPASITLLAHLPEELPSSDSRENGDRY